MSDIFCSVYKVAVAAAVKYTSIKFKKKFSQLFQHLKIKHSRHSPFFIAIFFMVFFIVFFIFIAFIAFMALFWREKIGALSAVFLECTSCD